MREGKGCEEGVGWECERMSRSFFCKKVELWLAMLSQRKMGILGSLASAPREGHPHHHHHTTTTLFR